jgi:hypothetical protein
LELKACIRELAEKRGLSLEVMAQLLGYRSPTSLKRIMNERVRPSTLSDFVKRMEAHMDLSAAESAALDRAVRVRRNGESRVREWEAFRSFLQGETLPAPETLAAEDPDTGTAVPLVRRYAGREGLRLTLVNCVYPEVFSLLRSLLSQGDAEAKHVIVAPLHGTGNAYIMTLMSTILRLQGYHGYIMEYPREAGGVHVRGPWGADLLLASWKEPGGGEVTELLTFRTQARAVAVPLRMEGETLHRLLHSFDPVLKTVKRSWPAMGSMEDYVSYSEDLAALEKDAEIFEIKPDPCLLYIPAEIQRAALEDGPIPAELLSPVLEPLFRTAQARNRNVYTKRRATHSIFKKGALRQLALTGRTLDHFWGFRPYTKEERLQIFGVLLEQAQKNRCVHLYLLREDDALRDMNLALYGGRGILLCEMDTAYDLGGGHSDLLFTPPRSFLEEFQKFYMTDLVKELCLPEGETVGYLTNLMNLVRESG